IESMAPALGDVDEIFAGNGLDRIIGGTAGDIINAGDGSNIVIGDAGYIDYVIADGDVTDIDRIWSTDTAIGGPDSITTGAGDDVVIGGQDGDTIGAGAGRNLVFGDNGQITAAGSDQPRFGTQALTLGRVETIDAGVGGA